MPAKVTEGRSVTWIDGEAYGRRIVLGGMPFPWCDTPNFVQSYGRLAALLKSDVIALNLGSFLEEWAGKHPAVVQGLQPGRRVSHALRNLLALSEPRGQFVEVVQAIRHSRKEVLALVLPPFEEWIGTVQRWSNPSAGPATADDDAIDDVAVAVADFSRILSSAGIDVLLVNDPSMPDISAERLELYSPLVNVAKHYKWEIGLRTLDTLLLEPLATEFDFLISRLARDTSNSLGVELSGEFWAGGELVPRPGLVYVEVPAGTSPEGVLTRLALLRDRFD